MLFGSKHSENVDCDIRKLLRHVHRPLSQRGDRFLFGAWAPDWERFEWRHHGPVSQDVISNR